MSGGLAAEQRGNLVVKIVDAVGDVAEQQVRGELLPPEGDAGIEAHAIDGACHHRENRGQAAVDFEIDNGVAAEQLAERCQRIAKQRHCRIVADDDDLIEHAENLGKRFDRGSGDQAELLDLGRILGGQQRRIRDHQAASAHHLDEGERGTARQVVIAAQDLAEQHRRAV